MNREKHTILTLIQVKQKWLILHRVEFKVRKVIRDKDSHYIMIKVSILHEDITVIIVYMSKADY